MPRCRGMAFRRKATELPPEFREYLVADGVVLPHSDKLHPLDPRFDAGGREYEVDSDDDDTVGEDGPPAPAPPSFPALEEWLEESIATLGGRVIPSLSWSAPIVRAASRAAWAHRWC